MRALLILVCLLLLLVVLMRLPSVFRLRLSPPGPPRRDELVKDPVCQTYVLMSRAVREEVAGAPVYFCGRECAARFHRGEHQA